LPAEKVTPVWLRLRAECNNKFKEVLAKLTDFGFSVFVFGCAVTGRTDTTTEFIQIY
jgi:hypothetical protein